MEYKICRRELSEGRLCNATIKTPNPLNWCAACRERLPFWPNEVEESATYQEVR